MSTLTRLYPKSIRPHPDHAAFTGKKEYRYFTEEFRRYVTWILQQIDAKGENKYTPHNHREGEKQPYEAKILGSWVPFSESLLHAEEWLYWIDVRNGWHVFGINDLVLVADSGRGYGLNDLEQLSEPPSLEILADFPDITHLSMSGGGITDFSPLAGLKKLTWLNLSMSGAKSIADLSPLAALKDLTWLKLRGFEKNMDLSPLAGLHNLTSLEVQYFRDIAPLAGLRNLTHLQLGWEFCGEHLPDISPLSGLTALRWLSLRDYRLLTDLKPLAGLNRLFYLRVGAGQLTDLSPLSELTELWDLDLSGCYFLNDLGPLAGLTGLKQLNLQGCQHIEDLSPLAGMTELSSLNLYSCNKVSDLRPLAGLQKLIHLSLHDCWRIPPEQREAVQNCDYDRLRSLLSTPAIVPHSLQKNQIQIIKPYRYLDHWVFDDPAVGLDKEPFVMGMGEIISAILEEKGIRHPDSGFFAYFSSAPMPGAEQLLWLREEAAGNWYRWREMEGWLCPALFRYFDVAPPVIHIRVAEAA